MIVILSYANYEQGTEYVIDWLHYYKADFIKLTMDDFYKTNDDIVLDVNKQKLFVKGEDVMNNVKVIFYRRLFADFSLQMQNRNIYKTQIEHEVRDESFTLVYYLFHLFREKTWLPSPSRANVNKLEMVDMAQKAGLLVPGTRVLNSKQGLKQFYKDCKSKIITKPIAKSSYYINDRFTYFANVNSITNENIEELPDHFFPSLFQEKIEKAYEIRVFYLDGQFYSLAQLNSAPTQYVDIKLNNDAQHTHWVNYQLPAKIEADIHQFMKMIRLNTGSLDIVRTKKGQYVFIEVNPVGQYGHGSFYGNYGLEKIIAEWLIKNDSNGKRN